MKRDKIDGIVKYRPVNLRDFPRDVDVSCVITGSPDCCLCHLNDFGSNGIGMKAPDLLGAVLSHEQHSYIDGLGRRDYVFKYEALHKTFQMYHRAGLRLCAPE